MVRLWIRIEGGEESDLSGFCAEVAIYHFPLLGDEQIGRDPRMAVGSETARNFAATRTAVQQKTGGRIASPGGTSEKKDQNGNDKETGQGRDGGALRGIWRVSAILRGGNDGLRHHWHG